MITTNSKKIVNKVKTKGKMRRQSLIFYWVMFAIPLVQFAIFYIGVNFNSILLAFKNYTIDDTTRKVVTEWVGFANFQKFISEFGSSDMWVVFGNSFIVCAVSIFIAIPINLFFSYFIHKKYAGSKFFQVILFLPTIISEMVLVSFFKVFAEQVMTNVFKTPNFISYNGDYCFITCLIFSTVINLGASTLVYTNAMSSISKSVLEAADIDGASPLRQFFSVVIPSIWPTITSYVVIAFVGLTTSQISIFSFYSNQMGSMDIKQWNLAAWSYWQLMKNSGVQTNYPYASAIGLFMTVFVAPLAMLLNHLLTKFGPSEK